MSRKVKKNVISLVSGLAITSGTIGTAVTLANLSSYNKNIITLNYDNLTKLRSNLIKNWLSKELTAEDFENLLVNSPNVISDEIINEYNSIATNNNFAFTMSYKRNGEVFSIILKPKSTDRFSLFKPSDSNNDVDFNAGNIILNNIKLWTGITFDNSILTNLRNQINNYIFINKLTLEEFINNNLSNEFNLDVFKKKIQDWSNNLILYESIQNITISNENNLSILRISSATEFSYQLNGQSKYYDSKTTNLIFDDLEFFTSISLNNDKLNDLESNIQNFIDLSSNRFTISEFNDQLNTIAFKTKISEFLSIDINLIERISYDNNILLIYPSLYKKFISSYNNTNIVDGNIEIASNFNFYNTINLVKLNELYNSINDLILEDNKKYTLDELKKYINDEYSLFKELVVNNLYISENETINPDLISKITLNQDGNINIELDSNYLKYSIVSSPNINLFNNYILVISGLNFYTSVLIEENNISNFKNSIQNYIDDIDNKFTIEQFSDNIKQDKFKEFVANSLSIDINLIDSINFDNINNLLTITPISLYKYNTTINSNLIVNGNILVSNLNFYSSKNLFNLNNLYVAINSYITNNSNQYTADEFKDELENNYSKIKELVVSNLYVAQDILIDPNLIDNIELNLSNQLEISLNTNYIKYSTNNTDNIEFVNNNQLVVKNLEFFNAINISFISLNDLKNSIQNYINNSSNQYTINEFKNQINSTEFKDYISNSLGIENSNVKTITFDEDNNLLSIVPNYLNKFITTQSTNLIFEGQINISSLEFYNSYSFNNLDNLYNGLNDYISEDDIKYTLSEFKLAVKNYPDALKQVIANSLSISSTESIDVKQISSISVNTNNELVINLNSNFSKYTANSTTNVVYSDNTIVVKNLNFYKSIKLDDTKLSSFKSNIQSYIDASGRRYTDSEFSNISLSTMKEICANYLGISLTDIGNVVFNIRNNKLSIYPSNLIKFIDDSGSDLILGGNIVLSNLKFYSIINISQTKINSFLSNFENYVKQNNITSNNLSNSLLINKLKNDLNINIEIDASISNDTRNSSRYQIKVVPNGYYKFNSPSGINNDDGSFIIDDVALMNNLLFTNNNLNNLRTNLQNFINSSYIANSVQMNAILPSIQKYIIQNLYVSDNSKVNSLSISNITWSDSSKTFQIFPNSIDYFTFAKAPGESSNSYYGITNGVIEIKSMTYRTYNTTSTSYFNLQGTNFVMSLTYNGSLLEMIDFPSSISGINYHIFDNNKNIKMANFTSSSITEFPNSLFLGCTNLKTVVMGNKITNMGINMCAGNTSLQSVMLSNKLKTIENSSFNGCTSLMGIKIPDSVNTVSFNAFLNCSSMNTIDFGTGLTKIENSAFSNCSSLTRLILPSSLTTINYQAFENCTSLLSIQIPDNIQFIAQNAFQGCTKLKLYVNSEETRNKILGFNLMEISSSDIIVGTPN